jgi:hypothetical protein
MSNAATSPEATMTPTTTARGVYLAAALMLGVSLALLAGQWASGYFLRLAPLGLLTPIVALALLALQLLSVLAALVYLIVGKSRLVSRLALVGVALLAASPPFWSRMYAAGFEARVRSLSQADWQRFASEVRAWQAASPQRRVRQRADRADRAQLEALAPAWPVLALGDLPPRVTADAGAVEITWGSGLLGTLQVAILASPVAKDGSGYFQTRRIYDHVEMRWE